MTGRLAHCHVQSSEVVGMQEAGGKSQTPRHHRQEPPSLTACPQSMSAPKRSLPSQMRWTNGDLSP